jgi:uncharacterized protein (UPF0332 family)
MPLADELLAQAYTLATTDPGVPSQANLRRAISAAYYALFHLLISEAVLKLVLPEPKGLRERAGRAFAHSELEKVCSAIVRSNLADKFGTLLGSGISSDLRVVAENFSLLQEARHTADYDVSIFLSRAAALVHVEKAHSACTSWSIIRNTDEANVFLTALAFAARWAK